MNDAKVSPKRQDRLGCHLRGLARRLRQRQRPQQVPSPKLAELRDSPANHDLSLRHLGGSEPGYVLSENDAKRTWNQLDPR